MKTRAGIFGGVLGLALALSTTVALAASLVVSSQKLSVFRPATLPPAGIVLDTTSSVAPVGKVSSLSWNHTVGSGSNRILVVGVSLRKKDRPVTGITYGGIGGFVFAGAAERSDADHRVEIWYKVAPAVGTALIAITLTGDVEVVGGAASFTGVHQTVPAGTFAGAFGGDATPTVTVSSATGEVVIDVLSINGNAGAVTVGAGQTQRWSGLTGTGDGNEFGAGSTEPGAASVTMSWSATTARKWAIGAIALKPA